VVPKCIFLDVVIMNSILLIAIMSIDSVTSPYFSNISSSILFTCCMGRLVVSPFTDPKFGPNMSSALKMSCLVMLQLGIIFFAFDVFDEIFSILSANYILKSTFFLSIRILSNGIFRVIAIYCIDQNGPNVMCYVRVVLPLT